MKGAIFIAFNEMIENTAGIDTWEQLLQRVEPKSGGIYTSVESYPDDELFALVGALSEITGKPASELVATFGNSLFGFLDKKYPIFTRQQPTFFDFIESIDGTIHKEVLKLYSDARLPHIIAKRLTDYEMLVLYSSPRKTMPSSRRSNRRCGNSLPGRLHN